jgi:hypothetical protein
MQPGLKALLTGLIDYAGLFPPAKLPLEQALANYLRCRESEDAWMLGRFVCPAARLKEIPEGVSLSCSAIGRGGSTPETFLEGFSADLIDIGKSHVRVEALETKLPPLPLGDDRAFGSMIGETVGRLPPTDLPVYFEALALDPARIPVLLYILGYHDRQGRLGFKLRAGGVEPSAFPSCEQVALALGHALRQALPVKATAGLHHPFPRFDEAVGARMHGFINLFTAGVLGHVHGMREQMLCAILEDADPAHFTFTDAGVRWGDLSATTEQIAVARREVVVSFGSCSFDEPRDDLRALGWL